MLIHYDYCYYSNCNSINSYIHIYSIYIIEATTGEYYIYIIIYIYVYKYIISICTCAV